MSTAMELVVSHQAQACTVGPVSRSRSAPVAGGGRTPSPRLTARATGWSSAVVALVESLARPWMTAKRDLIQ